MNNTTYSVAITKKMSVLKSCLNTIQIMCTSQLFTPTTTNTTNNTNTTVSSNMKDGIVLAQVLFDSTIQMNPNDNAIIMHMSEVCMCVCIYIYVYENTHMLYIYT